MPGMHAQILRWQLLLALLVASCQQEAPGFDTPESVLHDEADDVYLVSNIYGAPAASDDNGYIARVRPDGSFVRRHWIQGGRDGVTLHAPKGMALVGDVLWVADIDHLRKFDRRSGRPLGAVPVPGATFLNDVAAAPDGSVYVTDTGLDASFRATGTDAIWRVGPDGTLKALIRGAELGQPNGIVALAGGVYVVSWRDGTFYQVDRDGRRTDLGRAPTAQLDGLVRTRDGRWLCTSWQGECVYEFDNKGGVRKAPWDFEQPADCGYDQQRNRLLVPLFGKNELQIRQL